MKKQVVAWSAVLVLVLQQGVSSDTYAADGTHPATLQKITPIKTPPQRIQTISPVGRNPVGRAALQPVVAKCTPSALRLVAGALATTVTLSGSNLNLISGARIMKGNAAADQLTVKLVGNATAATASLAIGASGDAPAGNYGLSLLTTGGRPVNVPPNQLTIQVLPPLRTEPRIQNPQALPATGVQAVKTQETVQVRTLDKNLQDRRLIPAVDPAYKMLPADGLIVGEIIPPVFTMDRPPSGYVKFPPRGKVTFYRRENGNPIAKAISGNILNLSQTQIGDATTKLRATCSRGYYTPGSGRIKVDTWANTEDPFSTCGGELKSCETSKGFGIVDTTTLEGVCGGVNGVELNNLDISLLISFSCNDDGAVVNEEKTVTYPLTITCDMRPPKPAITIVTKWEYTCPKGYWLEGESGRKNSMITSAAPKNSAMCVNF